MGIARRLLLKGSQNVWLREHAMRYPFVRRSVSRFMPGETAEEALAAASRMQHAGLPTVFTLLGENIKDAGEAAKVRDHYVRLLYRIGELGLDAEVSVKLTQLGLDLDPDLCYVNLAGILSAAGQEGVVWIDMEASNYTDITLDVYRRALAAHPNTGVCLQSYLYRTAEDLDSLIPLGGAIRLVKGAYNEPAHIAFPSKQRVDENFFLLACRMLSAEARKAGLRAAFATHDLALIASLQQHAHSQHVSKRDLEFQMLYGIQRAAQLRLAQEGWTSIVLIAYGSYWFPWYMRRLAERPANVLFVARNLFAA